MKYFQLLACDNFLQVITYDGDNLKIELEAEEHWIASFDRYYSRRGWNDNFFPRDKADKIPIHCETCDKTFEDYLSRWRATRRYFYNKKPTNTYEVTNCNDCLADKIREKK